VSQQAIDDNPPISTIKLPDPKSRAGVLVLAKVEHQPADQGWKNNVMKPKAMPPAS